MKIDICEKKWTTKEVCKDIKYCCIFMKSMIAQHYIDIDIIQDDAVCNIYLDDDRNYESMYHYYEQKPKDILQLSNRIRIQFCPFCGEKINDRL